MAMSATAAAGSRLSANDLKQYAGFLALLWYANGKVQETLNRTPARTEDEMLSQMQGLFEASLRPEVASSASSLDVAQNVRAVNIVRRIIGEAVKGGLVFPLAQASLSSQRALAKYPQKNLTPLARLLQHVLVGGLGPYYLTPPGVPLPIEIPDSEAFATAFTQWLGEAGFLQSPFQPGNELAVVRGLDGLIAAQLFVTERAASQIMNVPQEIRAAAGLGINDQRKFSEVQDFLVGNMGLISTGVMAEIQKLFGQFNFNAYQLTLQPASPYPNATEATPLMSPASDAVGVGASGQPDLFCGNNSYCLYMAAAIAEPARSCGAELQASGPCGPFIWLYDQLKALFERVTMRYYDRRWVTGLAIFMFTCLTLGALFGSFADNVGTIRQQEAEASSIGSGPEPWSKIAERLSHQLGRAIFASCGLDARSRSYCTFNGATAGKVIAVIVLTAFFVLYSYFAYVGYAPWARNEAGRAPPPRNWRKKLSSANSALADNTGGAGSAVPPAAPEFRILSSECIQLTEEDIQRNSVIIDGKIYNLPREAKSHGAIYIQRVQGNPNLEVVTYSGFLESPLTKRIPLHPIIDSDYVPENGGAGSSAARRAQLAAAHAAVQPARASQGPVALNQQWPPAASGDVVNGTDHELTADELLRGWVLIDNRMFMLTEDAKWDGVVHINRLHTATRGNFLRVTSVRGQELPENFAESFQ